jgi:membrane fusion protein (multidrug efflux system)
VQSGGAKVVEKGGASAPQVSGGGRPTAPAATSGASQ